MKPSLHLYKNFPWLWLKSLEQKLLFIRNLRKDIFCVITISKITNIKDKESIFDDFIKYSRHLDKLIFDKD